MSPQRVIYQERHKEVFSIPATPISPAPTTHAVTNALRMTIVLLGSVSLSLIAIWLYAHVKVRLNRNKRNVLSLDLTGQSYQAIYPPPKSSSVKVFESDISIDMIGDDGRTQSDGTEFDDLSEHGSMETIISSVSATQMTFTHLPGLLQGNILERRGRKDLQCVTSQYYEASTITIGTGTISGRMEQKMSVTRPVFGFNFQEITPPVGSPLWNRKMDMPRFVCPGPLTHPPKLV